MSAPLPPLANTLFRLTLAAGALGAAGLGGLALIYVRSPYNTEVGDAVAQPVKFDHRHHVRDDGIDCLYCHDTAETSARAGLPPTERCLNCHDQIWASSPLLAPVRESYFENQPIPWKRVHVLPDFVYFNHSIHVAKGVGCVECHGRVDLMAEVMKTQPLTMSWCLDCHRNPVPHLRPPSEITNMEWTPPHNETTSRQADSLTHCSTCHR